MANCLLARNRVPKQMLDLLDYRRRVFAMYQRIRELGTDAPEAFALFCSTRDDLFGGHPQSALDEKQMQAFTGLRYHDYDPAYRVISELKRADSSLPETVLDGGEDGAIGIRQIGEVHFDLPTGTGHLGVFWVLGYGGGIFIPFRDTTNGKTTYGGGRYLYDTIKGADLGTVGDALVLDFNYAYHPSCYYNPRWVCPLAPPTNQLNFPIEAGEKLLW